MKATFVVHDMTCNHCVQTITRAVQSLSADARVQADLASHRVTIEAPVDASQLQQAIAAEGYDVQPA
ncbi:heavy-metal-associated domain-containing protein [Castellaniella sp.]|uniref:heavy-metal-associated domain-containing protein n=1 Tax=Castellaniella sp. TaxID=1955812 RepID=UPI00356084EF